MANFDYANARKSGYSDDEINKFLGFNYKGALDSGYSQDEINAFLDKRKNNAQTQTSEQPQNLAQEPHPQIQKPSITAGEYLQNHRAEFADPNTRAQVLEQMKAINEQLAQYNKQAPQPQTQEPQPYYLARQNKGAYEQDLKETRQEGQPLLGDTVQQSIAEHARGAINNAKESFNETAKAYDEGRYLDATLGGLKTVGDVISTPIATVSGAVKGAYNHSADENERYKNTALQLSADINNVTANLGNFFENEQESSERAKNNADKLIKALQDKGYTEIYRDGNSVGIKDLNGEMIDLSEQGFLRNMISASGEIAGAIAGGSAGLKAAANANKLGKFAAMSGGSALGAGVGKGSDTSSVNEYYTNDEKTNAILKAFRDDLMAGVALGTAIKGVQKIAPHIPLKTLKDTAINLYEKTPTAYLQRQIIGDNIDGATSASIKSLGGEAEYSKALTSAKNALGDIDQSVLTSESVKTIPLTKNETINKGINFVNEKVLEPLQNDVKKVLQGANIAQKESELLLSNLAHENGAKNILNAMAKDADAYEKGYKIFSNLNQSAKTSLDNAFKDTSGNIIKTLDDYAKGVKAQHGEVVDTLSKAFNEVGESTANIAKIKRELITNVRKYFGNDEFFKEQITDALLKNKGFKGLNEARNLINERYYSITPTDSKTFSERAFFKSMRDSLDNAIDEVFLRYEKVNPNLAPKAKELLQTARSDYKKFYDLQDSGIYKAINNGNIKTTDNIINALVKSSDNQIGLNLDEFLSIVGKGDREKIESALFKGVLEQHTKDGITDFKALMKALENVPFRSEKMINTIKGLNENLPILKNTSDILKEMSGMTPKGKEMSQGISKNVASRLETMKANLLVEKLKSKLPFFGNNQALKNHLANALKNVGDLNIAIKNLDSIPTENLPTATKKALDEFKKEFSQSVGQVLKDNTDNIIKGLKERPQIVGKLKNQELAEQLGFKHTDDVKFEVNQSTYNHIKARHGENSELVKNSGQKPITDDEIANFGDLVNSANEHKKSLNSNNQNVLASFKQIDSGHYVVVETISTKQNKLKLQTMYFENGKFENSKAYKGATLDLTSETIPTINQTSNVTLDKSIAKETLSPTEYDKPQDYIKAKANGKVLSNKQKQELAKEWKIEQELLKENAPTFNDVSAQSFATTLNNTVKQIKPRDAWRVSVYDANHYVQDGIKLRTTANGSTVAVTADKDIISVASLGKGEGSFALKKARAMGGVKLDAYEKLYDFYAKNGFEPVSWCKWDDKFAPSGWNSTRDDKENIIFWIYKGDKAKKYPGAKAFFNIVKASDDYEKAQILRDNLLKK